jgi:hypothetical protein
MLLHTASVFNSIVCAVYLTTIYTYPTLLFVSHKGQKYPHCRFIGLNVDIVHLLLIGGFDSLGRSLHAVLCFLLSEECRASGRESATSEWSAAQLLLLLQQLASLQTLL